VSYYIYINKSLKRIDDLVQRLPANWKNVSGLNLFSDEKLSNLEWAGHPDVAWVPLKTFDFTDYTYDPIWFDISKNNIKADIRRQKKERLEELLTWKGKNFLLNDTTKSGLVFVLLSNSETFPWDFVGETAIITKADAQEMIDFITSYTMSVHSAKEEMDTRIDSTTTLSELQELDLNLEWPLTTL